MFGLFKRTKLNHWEEKLLKNIFKKLGVNYSNYYNQVEDGLFRGVAEGMGGNPNYITFLFNSDVFKQYEDKKGSDLVMKGISVFDNRLKNYIDFNIYISFGVIIGYETPQTKKPSLDIDKINVSGFITKFIHNKDSEKIKDLLTESELKLINISEVYEVELENKLFFVLKDFGEGNVICIDYDKKKYIVIHDPFQIIMVDKKLEDILEKGVPPQKPTD